MIVKSFNFSKAGSPDGETEDAVSYNLEKMRFSVCDGAGDSIFSPLWAACLSSQFTDNDFDLSLGTDMEKYINGCRMKWYESIDWENLRWNVKKKAVFGSYSTFLAASFVEDDVTYARVWARGDSCLFLFKENSVETFPLKDTKEFGLHPELVWSGYGNPMKDKRDYKFPEVKYMEFEFEELKGIIMATDSISKYIMERGDTTFEEVLDNIDNREFFDIKRSNGDMRNDDVSAIIISSL